VWRYSKAVSRDIKVWLEFNNMTKERIVIKVYLPKFSKAWIYVRRVEVYRVEGKTYLFAKWVVYDSKGDVVLDAPRTIEVVVPAGERYTAVAYYGSSPSLLLVNSSPEEISITVNVAK